MLGVLVTVVTALVLAIGLDVAVLLAGDTEVLLGLTAAHLATEEDAVVALGGIKSKLVKGEALTADLLDTGTGSLGEAESSDAHLRDNKHTLVVGDSANNNGGLALVNGHELVDRLDRQRVAVLAAKEKAVVNTAVEVRLSPASKVLVGLDEHTLVLVVAHGSASVTVSYATLINAH